MPSEIGAGVLGLAGALIGGLSTMGGQVIGDRRAQGREARADHRRYVAALRLTLLDLDRSDARLARMRPRDLVKPGDPRGYTELPRGAWLEYRAVLALNLEDAALTTLADAYNEVVEWNEVVWAAFADRPPELFHASDQHRLDEPHSVALLDDRYPRLANRIHQAAETLREVLEREIED
jgi:hypothetical protein